MGRIAERFAVLRARRERALIPFVTAGDPDLTTTEALVPALAEAGADGVEIGVPFSDPMAEGPTIQVGVPESHEARCRRCHEVPPRDRATSPRARKTCPAR